MDECGNQQSKQEKYEFLELVLLRCLQRDTLDFRILTHNDDNFRLLLQDSDDTSVIVYRRFLDTRPIEPDDFDEEGEFSLTKCLESISFLQNTCTKANYFIFTNRTTERLNFPESPKGKFEFLNFTNSRLAHCGEGDCNVFIDQVPSNLRLGMTEALTDFTSRYNVSAFQLDYILERFYLYITQNELFSKGDAQFALLDLFMCKYKVDLMYNGSKSNDFWNCITSDRPLVIVRSSLVTETFLKAYTAATVAKYGDASDLAYKKLWRNGLVSLLTKSDDIGNITNILKAFPVALRVTVLTTGDCGTVFDLEDSYIRQLSTCKVSLQGKSTIRLDKLLLKSLRSDDVISLITNNFVMDFCYKKLPPYFIERSFLRTILRLDVVNDLRNEVFVITNRSGVTNLSLKALENLPNVFIVEENECGVEQRKGTVHFVESHGENWLEWKWSRGDVENLRKFDISLESGFICDFTHLVISERNVNILVMEPAMGKTTLLDYIALRLRDEWVFTVDLKRYMSSYKPKTALEHLFEFHNGKSELARKILTQFVDANKIHILLDEYDEVADDAIELIICLKDAGFHVWIPVSSKNALHLQERLGTMATLTKPFTLKNQYSFLTEYFRQFCNKCDGLEEFVNTLIRIIRTKVDAFLDSPLYLTFIADIYTEEFKHFYITGGLRLADEFVLLNFLDAFSQRYINYLSSKYNYDRSKISLHLTESALQTVFPECDLKGNILQELTDDFPHPILAHYIIAKWMCENVSTNLVRALYKKRFDSASDYGNLFKMFDLMLTKGFPLHTAIIEGKFNLVLSRLGDTDIGGRNVVHIAALYGTSHPRTHTIRSVDVEDSLVNVVRLADAKTLEACDRILGYSTLEYSVVSGRFAIANAICEKIPRLLINAYIDLTQQENCIEYCIRINGYKHLFRTLLKYILCLRVATGNLRANSRADALASHLNLDEVTEQDFQNYVSTFEVRTLIHLMEKLQLKKEGEKYFVNLHLACAYGDERNIFDLLKAGAKINNLGDGSHTPFHAAVIHKRTDNIDVLLGARANMNTVDAFGNTALHLACQNVDASLVNKLIRKGADISIQNHEGDTAFHLALKKPCEQSAELFLPDKYYSLLFSPQTSISRDRCLDVNIQNKNGDTPLLLALKHNCGSIVRELLEYHADVHVVNKTGNSCLHYAAETDDYKTTLELIYYCVNMNGVNDEGETPLLIALKNRYVRIARLLLSKGAQVGNVDKSGSTNLHYASQMGLKDLVTNILDKGVDIDKQNSEGQTALTLALISKRSNAISLLLRRGANPNVLDNRGCNGLHYAAEYMVEGAVRHLIASGCNIDQVNNEGHTPLMLAIGNGSMSMVKLFLNAGASVEMVDRGGSSCLHLAVLLPILIEDLLKLGANVNEENNNGSTPLMIAIERQCTLTIDTLMKNGADVFLENKSGFSAIHYAAQYAADDTLLELINKGVDINKKTHAGETPLLLHLKHWYASSTTTKLLLAKGADVHVIDGETGNSLLHYATEKGNQDLVEIFLKKNVDINLQNNEGETPLHFAIKRGNDSIARLFLSKGADVHIADRRNGNTCLHSAVIAGEEGLIGDLLKHGANLDAANNDGEIPLTRAQRLGHSAIVSMLLNFTSTSDNSDAVFSAIRNGEIVDFKKFVNDGFDLNKQDENGDTPLLCAMKHNKVAIVDYLLSEQVDVTISNNLGVTSLHRAVELGDVKVVLKLIESGCDIDALSVNGNSPLLLAISSSRFHVAQLLLERNAKIDNIPLTNDEGSCLHSAGKQGAKEIVCQLLEKGLDVNLLSKFGLTPLMESLTNAERLVALTLIENGADVNVTTQWGYSCLSAAVDSQYLDVINLVLDKGAAINYVDDSQTALIMGIANEKRASVKVLLSRGANVHIGSEWSGCSLHVAAETGMDDFVSFILKEGSDINKCSKSFESPLHKAVSRCHFSTTKLLISKGAYLDTYSDCFNSLLGLAATNGWDELVEKLIKSGADLHHENDYHQTPLHLAMVQVKVNVVKLIFAEIVAQNYKDDDWNYLHYAVEFGDATIISALLDIGYDINKLNSYGETPLLLALKKEKLNTAKLLLAKGADYNINEDTEGSCLHYFAQYGWNTMVSKMIAEGWDVNIKKNDGATPLHWATQFKNYSTVLLLLSEGADPTIENSSGRTALHQSIDNNCKRTLKAILNGFDVTKNKKAIQSAAFLALDLKYFDLLDLLVDHIDGNPENDVGESMVLVAVKSGRQGLVRQILVDVNEISSEGNSILMTAVECGDIEMIKFLLEREADPNLIGANGNSCLHYAVRASEEVLLLFLESTDIDLKNSDGLTPLLYALEEAYTHSAQLLIAFGANVYVEDSLGSDCLHYAVKVGAEELVKYLIESGMDIHKKTMEGDDCLDLAINKGYMEIAKLLIAHGADVHRVNRFGENCLLKAVEESNEFVVDLLEKGVNVNQQCNRGYTPFTMALEKSNAVHAKMLLEKNADIASRNKCGSNLHYAISQTVDIVEELLELGVDMDEQNDQGDTPLLLALQGEMEETVKLLLEKGANIHIRNNDYNSCLHNAVDLPTEELLSAFIAKGADVNCVNLSGESPLLKALKRNKLEHAKILLANGARCDAIDHENGSCLFYAAKYGFDELVKDFISKGVNIHHPHFNGNALLIALEQQKTATVKLLIDHGADIHYRTYPNSSLDLVIQLDDVDIMETLLKKGIDINYRLSNGEPLVVSALRHKCKAVVDFLIAKGANVHLATHYSGNTCLHKAVCAEYEDVVEDLLNKGVDVNCENNKRETPLRLAFVNKLKGMVKLLLSHGASLDEGNFRDTYLHHAAEWGDDSIVGELIRRGADLNALNADCNTPIFLAVSSKNVSTVKLLLENGADYNLKNKDARNLLYVAKIAETDDLIVDFLNLGLKDDDVE